MVWWFFQHEQVVLFLIATFCLLSDGDFGSFSIIFFIFVHDLIDDLMIDLIIDFIPMTLSMTLLMNLLMTFWRRDSTYF